MMVSTVNYNNEQQDVLVSYLIMNHVETKINIYSSPEELAEAFALELYIRTKTCSEQNKTFTLALSGGTTPRIIYSQLARRHDLAIPWQWIHLFWSDERCVQPDDKESNYGMTRQLLLDNIGIPQTNIHRIRGEDDPREEARRYTSEIKDFTVSHNGSPSFDLILLGIGQDGHTASIFPDQMGLLQSDEICEVSIHPLTLQKRITLTGKIINNASSLTFLAIGKHKARVVSEIIHRDKQAENYPAFYISLTNGDTEWFLDEEAALFLGKE
jgi:6-phosphogluconolactonase